MITKSYTIRGGGRFLAIFTDCAISAPAKELAKIANNNLDCVAIWDTGSTKTCINPRLVEQLGLAPIGTESFNTVNGCSKSDLYVVDVYLPNNLVVSSIVVAVADVPNCDVLLGMDIATLGDFVLTNRNGESVFSFQMPSVNYVDFTIENDITAVAEGDAFPIPPCLFLERELNRKGISIRQLIQATNLDKKEIKKILSGEQGLTIRTANLFEPFIGVSAKMLIKSQEWYYKYLYLQNIKSIHNDK